MSLAASNIAADTAVEPARSRIMDEAANLFLQRGYEGTSLRQLAEVVGMKAGSLYYHFSSKDQLLSRSRGSWRTPAPTCRRCSRTGRTPRHTS